MHSAQKGKHFFWSDSKKSDPHIIPTNQRRSSSVPLSWPGYTWIPDFPHSTSVLPPKSSPSVRLITKNPGLPRKAPRMPYKRGLQVFGYDDPTCAACGGSRLVLGAMPASTHTSMLILPR